MTSKTLGGATRIVMGQSPPGDLVTSESVGLPLLNGPTEFGSHHPLPVQFTTDARKRANPGDLLFCVRGSTTGRMNWADREYAIGRGIAAIRHKQDSELQPFVRAVVEFGLPDLLAQATGSTFPNVSSAQLSDIPYPNIGIDEQRAIAGLLGALDDKSEQNRRTARALERLVQAIFRAWFVDFEPVKAKAAGATAFPSMPQPVFNALPTRFVDSDIGPVPEGWDVKAMNKCVQLTMGQSPPSEYYNEAEIGLPFHQGVTDFGFRFPTHRVYCTVESRIAEPRDALLSVRAPVGRINVANRRLVLGRGLAGLRHPNGRQSFLLHLLGHVFAEEDAVGDGTIYKAVTKQFLSQMPMLSPQEDAQSAFENIAYPLDELVAACEIESCNLAEMRDYLLPKLLSGRVRVNDTDLLVPGGVA